MPTVQQAKETLSQAQVAERQQQNHFLALQQPYSDAWHALQSALEAQISSAFEPEEYEATDANVQQRQILIKSLKPSFIQAEEDYKQCCMTTEAAKESLVKAEAAEQEAQRLAAEQAEQRARQQRLALAEERGAREKAERYTMTQQRAATQRSVDFCIQALTTSSFHFSPKQSRQIIQLFQLNEKNTPAFLKMIHLVSCVYNLNEDSLIKQLNELKTYKNLVNVFIDINEAKERQTVREKAIAAPCAISATVARDLSPSHRYAPDHQANPPAKRVRISPEPLDTSWQQRGFDENTIAMIMEKINRSSAAYRANYHAMINTARDAGLKPSDIVNYLHGPQGFTVLGKCIKQIEQTRESIAHLPSPVNLYYRTASAPPTIQASNSRQRHGSRSTASVASSPAFSKPQNQHKSTHHFEMPDTNHYDPANSAPSDAQPSPYHYPSTNAQPHYTYGSPSPSPRPLPRLHNYDTSPVPSLARAMSAVSPMPTPSSQSFGYSPSSQSLTNREP